MRLRLKKENITEQEVTFPDPTSTTSLVISITACTITACSAQVGRGCTVPTPSCGDAMRLFPGAHLLVGP